MKLFLVNCFCLVLFCSFGQKGYKVIRHAEEQIEKGNYKKANRLLNKAESMNYGFCGLAWIDAHHEIRFHRTKIFVHNEEYLKAANELNNLQYDFYSSDIDSLKMVYFIKALGKDRIKKEIDSCLQAMTSIDEADLLSYEVCLKVGFSDKPFTISYERNQIICMKTLMPNKESTLIDRFRKAVTDQTFYKLLL